jgi:DNA-binding NtrC family response regulator
MSKTIMVIDGGTETLELYRKILQDEGGYRVQTATFLPRMLEAIKELRPDLIISDHDISAEDTGWQFLQRLKMDRETAGIPVIVCSGAIKTLREMEGYLTEKKIGILYKPFTADELLALVERKLAESEYTSVLDLDKTENDG